MGERELSFRKDAVQLYIHCSPETIICNELVSAVHATICLVEFIAGERVAAFGKCSVPTPFLLFAEAKQYAYISPNNKALQLYRGVVYFNA
jgi:hypothetical protein